MGQAELLIGGLLVAVAGFSALARVINIPYPIVLVAGGAPIGFIPGIGDVKLDPEVVLVLSLPPLPDGAAFSSYLDVVRPILGGLPGEPLRLVLALMLLVSFVYHGLIHM